MYVLVCQVVHRLQLIQNWAARVVSGANRRQHITPIRESLHWLPIETRIRYKAVMLTRAPPLRSCLMRRDLPVRLRSSSSIQYDTAKIRTKAAEKSYRFACATEWNRLPVACREAEPMQNWGGCCVLPLTRHSYLSFALEHA